MPCRKPESLSVKTKWGVFRLLMTPKGLCEIQFPGQYPSRGPILKTRRRGLDRVASRFRDHLENPARKAKIKLDLSGHTSFERKVYRTLLRVRAGGVLSYGELAKRAGYPGAARAVGSAMHKNRLPIVIPCHRVVPVGGGVGRYAAGKVWKCRLLENEGVLSCRGDKVFERQKLTP